MLSGDENGEEEREMEVEKRLFDVPGLSAYLTMPVPTIYAYVHRGRIPAECVRRVGRALRFEKAAIDSWISGLSGSQAIAPGRIESGR